MRGRKIYAGARRPFPKKRAGVRADASKTVRKEGIRKEIRFGQSSKHGASESARKGMLAPASTATELF